MVPKKFNLKNFVINWLGGIFIPPYFENFPDGLEMSLIGKNVPQKIFILRFKLLNVKTNFKTTFLGNVKGAKITPPL